MKFSKVASVATLLAAPVLSAPTDIKYGPPKGGWESVDYPKGTGENLEHYPAPPGGWENVDYPKGTGENLEHYPPPPKGDDEEKDDEPEFTSRYHITAVGAEVRNGTVSVPGPADAWILQLWNQLQDRENLLGNHASQCSRHISLTRSHGYSHPRSSSWRIRPTPSCFPQSSG